MTESTDVFVIGGGPAGLAAAIAASNKGFRVTVADGSKPPIEKACGEGLMPDTLAALRELGIPLDEEEGFPFRGIRFIDGPDHVESRFPSAPGIGMRRRLLHQKMIDRAVERGVRLLWETPVMSVHRGEVLLACGERITAKWIVGADGGSSRVRKWAALDAYSEFRERFAYRQHFWIKPWTDCVEVYWSRECQAYMTPVSPEQVCLTMMSSGPAARVQTCLSEFPELRDRLSTASAASAERGAVTTMHRLKSVCRGQVALVGDASGSVDAITGEGLSLAFRQANALASAIASGNLENYARAHCRIRRRPALMATLLLVLGKNAGLRGRVFRTLAADPKLFSHLLSVHVGVTSPAHCLVTSAKLGWQLVTV